MRDDWSDLKKATAERLQRLIRAAAKERGITNYDLASLVDCSQGNLSHALYKGRNLTIYTAARICAAMGYELHFTLKRTGADNGQRGSQA